MKNLIAVIDDEPDILDLVSLHLKKSGFDVAEFLDAEKFLRSLPHKTPDLIVLDLMLPDIDGIEVCKLLKKDPKYAPIPIIILTARVEETDRVLGLELGADDYITKPFSPRELVARVKAVLRRAKDIKKDKDVGYIEIGQKLLIDLNKYEVYVNGKKIDLTPTEFKILRLLAMNKGWVFSREKILNEVWGSEKDVLDRTVDVHIKNLREKLGKMGKYIKNIRGVGYKLEE